MTISGGQLAAARSLLGWSQKHLARAADVTEQTIKDWEAERHMPWQATADRVRRAIEDRGVEFSNGGALGVRFKPKPGASAETESAVKSLARWPWSVAPGSGEEVL